MARVSRETIARAVADLGLGDEVISRLAMHWDLVTEWNRRTNLTAINDLEQAAWLHYRDSLEALSVLTGASPIIDMGSGGGFPGIPIAAALPAQDVILVEPRRKRASFLETAVARIGLQNVRVLTMRVEDRPTTRGTVVTRATFSNPVDLRRCLEWVDEGNALVAFRSDPGELQPDAIHWYQLRSERRCLLIWRRRAESG